MADPNESPGGVVITPQTTSAQRIDSVTLTSGSSTVLDLNCQSTDVGSFVDGANIPIGTTITAVTAGTSFTMSANALASGKQPVTIHPQIVPSFSGGGYPTMPAVPSAGAFGYSSTDDTPLYGSATHTASNIGSGTISDITSTGGTVTITNPTGPTTNLEVTNPGGTITTIESTDGSLTVTGGTGPTANIVLTNPITEGLQIQVSGGVTGLSVTSSSGQPFLVGDGSGDNLYIDYAGRIIVRSGLAPTATAGAQLSSVTVSTGSTDMLGTITGTSVASPAAGAICTVTFNASFTTGGTRTPIVILTPSNAATSALGLYVSAISDASFTVSSSTAIAGSTAISFNYIAMGR